MIDLDEEQARMESMLDRRERMALGVTCTEMIELITRLRQAEKDAARYRWLARKVGAHGIIDGWAFSFPTHLSLPATSFAMEDPDVALGIAIDEAMQCNK